MDNGWGSILDGITESWSSAENRIFVLVRTGDEDLIRSTHNNVDAAFSAYARQLVKAGYCAEKIAAGHQLSSADFPPIEYAPVDGPLFSIYIGGGGDAGLPATYEWRIDEHEVGYEHGRAIILPPKKRA